MFGIQGWRGRANLWFQRKVRTPRLSSRCHVRRRTISFLLPRSASCTTVFRVLHFCKSQLARCAPHNRSPSRYSTGTCHAVASHIFPRRNCASCSHTLSVRSTVARLNRKPSDSSASLIHSVRNSSRSSSSSSRSYNAKESPSPSTYRVFECHV